MTVALIDSAAPTIKAAITPKRFITIPLVARPTRER